jgi:hypothetical protein
MKQRASIKHHLTTVSFMLPTIGTIPWTGNQTLANLQFTNKTNKKTNSVALSPLANYTD